MTRTVRAIEVVDLRSLESSATAADLIDAALAGVREYEAAYHYPEAIVVREDQAEVLEKRAAGVQSGLESRVTTLWGISVWLAAGREAA